MTPTPPPNHARVCSSPNTANRKIVKYNSRREIEASPAFFNGNELMAGKILLDLQKNPNRFVISPNNEGCGYSIQFYKDRLVSLDFEADEDIAYEGQRFRTFEAFLNAFKFKTTDALPLSPSAKAPTHYLKGQTHSKNLSQ